MRKKAGINVDNDAEASIFQRNPEAVFSNGIEQANVENTNEVLDRLFSKKAEMAKQAEDQLSALFSTKERYGRNMRLGMSADEASKVVNRAFK